MGGAHLSKAEDAMPGLRNVEALLQDAIALLTDSGFPLAAQALRDNLHGIREAPTAAARRHRIFQLREHFEDAGSAPDHYFCAPAPRSQVYRFTQMEAHRR